MFRTLLTQIWTKWKKDIVYVLIILGLCFSLCISIKSCSSSHNLNDSLNKSLISMTDSIEYYRDSYGDIVAKKTILEGDMSTLKIANEDLYKKVKELESRPDKVVYVDGKIENPKDSIIYIDSFPGYREKRFAFVDEWRNLQGRVYADSTVLGLNIDKNEIYFDYTLTIKDNEVQLSSTNPYVRYNKISGLSIPDYKQKQKRWSIGPSLGYGYDFANRKFVPYIGFSISYGLIVF